MKHMRLNITCHKCEENVGLFDVVLEPGVPVRIPSEKFKEHVCKPGYVVEMHLGGYIYQDSSGNWHESPHTHVKRFPLKPQKVSV